MNEAEMKSEDDLEQEIEELEREIDEIKASIPPHSVKFQVIQWLEDKEHELKGKRDFLQTVRRDRLLKDRSA